MWPPPSRPRPRAAEPRPETKQAAAARAPAAPPRTARTTAIVGVLAGTAFALAALVAPPEFLEHLTVFLLSCIVGWHVIWNVTPALHTPLMSVTNAISGIILMGGMLVMSGRADNPPSLLGAVAALVAAINVAGGFLVTQRMLRMFRK
jgi:NAD(P) transhydrogenase subunit alpha